MSAFSFNIKIKPIVKESDWEVKLVGSGRKEKTCGHCGKTIPIGASAYTLSKQVKNGANRYFPSEYACIGHQQLLLNKINERETKAKEEKETKAKPKPYKP